MGMREGQLAGPREFDRKRGLPLGGKGWAEDRNGNNGAQ